jgi:hypothetical protein
MPDPFIESRVTEPEVKVAMVAEGYKPTFTFSAKLGEFPPGDMLAALVKLHIW